MEPIEIENFLPKIKARELETLVHTDTRIPWHYYFDFTIGKVNKERYMLQNYIKNDSNILQHKCGVFIHELIKNAKITSEFHNYFETIPKIIEQKFNLQIDKVMSMRMNLVTPIGYKSTQYTCPHYDYNINKCKIFIYYITDADGETVIFNERYDGTTNFDKKTLYKKIVPQKNKAVVFDALQYHAFCMPSENVRAIINMNFLTKN